MEREHKGATEEVTANAEVVEDVDAQGVDKTRAAVRRTDSPPQCTTTLERDGTTPTRGEQTMD